MISAQERPLPAFVQREFADYLKCGRLDYGFLRTRCSACHAEKLVAFNCNDSDPVRTPSPLGDGRNRLDP